MFIEPGFVTAGSHGRSAPARSSSGAAPLSDWDSLAEPLQVRLAAAALHRAAASIAMQAEVLAREMETGTLEDRDGPEALRLLAAVVRLTADDGIPGTPRA